MPGDPSNRILTIRLANGSTFAVKAPLHLSIHEFKAVLAGNCDVPADRQRLIHKGRILKDERTLQSYGVESDHTIHLVRSIAPSTASSTTSSTMATANSGMSRTPRIRGGHGGSRALAAIDQHTIRMPPALPRSTESAGTPLLFSGPGANNSAGNRSSGLLGTETPSLDEFQQHLTQNPAVMREIMNLPVIQNIMNNPEIMQNFIMNNPQMRQIIDQNPQVGHVLNDPSILQQTLEAARNSELMREMMRNTDRAMSNIESSLEGFNMLRRMHETVQQPFLSAATTAGDTGSDLGSNVLAARLGNQSAAQPGDDSRNSATSTAPTAPTAGSPAPNATPLPNPWNTTFGGTRTSNTRSNLASNARRAGTGGMGRRGIRGMGGRGTPDLERVAGSMLDSTQFMRNPAMAQLMQNLLSDLQSMNQILSFNPNVISPLESNPQFREMLQNPGFLRQVTSPETIQQLLSLQQSLFSRVGQQQPREQRQTGSGTGLPNSSGLESFMNLFGGAGTGSLGDSLLSNLPPEERYADQLTQLQEMGFFDAQENIQALIAAAGNVQTAVEQLLGNLR